MYVLLLLTQTYMPALGVRQFHAIHFIPFALKNAQTKIKYFSGKKIRIASYLQDYKMYSFRKPLKMNSNKNSL